MTYLHLYLDEILPPVEENAISMNIDESLPWNVCKHKIGQIHCRKGTDWLPLHFKGSLMMATKDFRAEVEQIMKPYLPAYEKVVYGASSAGLVMSINGPTQRVLIDKEKVNTNQLFTLHDVTLLRESGSNQVFLLEYDLK